MFANKSPQEEDHSLILYHFQVNFVYLYENFNLNMTLKVNIVIHHYSDYFDWTGRTMHFTNGEFVDRVVKNMVPWYPWYLGRIKKCRMIIKIYIY